MREPVGYLWTEKANGEKSLRFDPPADLPYNREHWEWEPVYVGNDDPAGLRSRDSRGSVFVGPDQQDLIIVGDTAYPVPREVCRAFNVLLDEKNNNQFAEGDGRFATPISAPAPLGSEGGENRAIPPVDSIKSVREFVLNWLPSDAEGDDFKARLICKLDLLNTTERR